MKEKLEAHEEFYISTMAIEKLNRLPNPREKSSINHLRRNSAMNDFPATPDYLRSFRKD